MQPRNTDFFQLRARSQGQEWQAALKIVEVCEAWDHACAAFGLILAKASGLPYPLSADHSEFLWEQSASDRAVYEAALARLVTVIRERAPKIATVWGTFLPQHVRTMVLLANGVEEPSDIEQRAEALSPKDPIRRLGPNTYYIPEDLNEYRDAKHLRQCLLELSGYIQALNEPKRRGRRPKTGKVATPSRAMQTDPRRDRRAIEAYKLDEERKEKGQKREWEKIAEALVVLGRSIHTDGGMVS